MMFENMVPPDSMLPLDNIINAQNAANLQNMMAMPNGRMMPQTTTTLQDMMARQNAALAQNRTAMENASAIQNTRTVQNATVQNNGAPPSTMPVRNANTVAAMQPNRGGANTKVQAAQQLAQSCFAVHEAVLYLDTHPDDQNALEYYRRKQQQLMQASENYQKTVGPIRACAVDTESGSWRWVETPWPWEIEED